MGFWSVLVVEPHQLLRELMVELVRQLPDVRVALASTAESAIDQARSHPPTILLLDTALPDLATGEAVCRLRAAAPTARLVLIGDQPIAAYREMASRSGVDLCLEKEKMAAELLPALRWLMGEEDPTAGSIADEGYSNRSSDDERGEEDGQAGRGLQTRISG